MKSGYAEEVIDTSARERAPLAMRDAALVAHHQRGNDARIRCVAELCENAFAHRCAGRGDPGDRRGGLRREALRRGRFAHIAAGIDAALQHPGFEVEAVRIAGSIGHFHPHGQLPAFPCPHSRFEIYGVAQPVAGQLDSLQKRGIRGDDLLDVEHEALAARIGVRQVGDHADKRDIHPLPVRGQAFGQPRIRPPGGPGKAERHAQRQNGQTAKKFENGAGENRQPQRREQQRQQPQPAGGRQHGLLLQPPHAETERDEG